MTSNPVISQKCLRGVYVRNNFRIHLLEWFRKYLILL